MALPTFLVIGAMRSGTSTLYQLLSQHPDVFMATPKEPNYFASPGEPAPLIEGSESVTDPADYEALFAPGGDNTARGEASHNYLYYSGRAAPAIRAALEDVKLIAILRNPIDRAFSHYLLHLRNDQEQLSFVDALDKEPERIKSGSHFGHYVQRGFYAKQLRPFFDEFPRDALQIHLYDDLAADADALCRQIYGFIGVEPHFTPDSSVRSNPSGIPRSRALHAVLVRDNPLKRVLQPLLPRSMYRWAVRLRDRNLGHPTMEPETRERLREVYRADIEELQTTIGRDLSGWLI